jgi:hypothetical protein
LTIAEPFEQEVARRRIFESGHEHEGRHDRPMSAYLQRRNRQPHLAARNGGFPFAVARMERALTPSAREAKALGIRTDLTHTSTEDRRPLLVPGLGFLNLCRKLKEQMLPTKAASELHTDWEP